MKKRFLPFSLLLVIMVLGQSMAIADNGGHYVPRTQGNATAETFMRDLRVNQQTGLIDPAWLFQATQSETSRNMSSNGLYWISMGPDNMGGQTTAVVYDNQSNVVYIGSKGGGVFKSYNLGVTWHQVGNKDLMVSCMTQDENGIIYVGTGDCGSAATFNGLDQQGYENSFIGSGIYTIDAKNDNAEVELLVAPTADEWNFINDLVCFKGGLLAATNEGLKYYKNQQWEMVIEGRADEVRATSNFVVASVDGMIYTGTDLNNMECHSVSGIMMEGDTLIPAAAGLLDIAIAPSDENIIYASCVGTDGVHSGIYVSRDKGATWEIALPAVATNLGDNNNVYGSYGLNNHGIVVDPTNAGRVFILGYSLFKIEQPASGEGYYITQDLTSVNGGTIYQSDYLHVGLHVMVFNPKNPNEFYVGTDGGVYKGSRTSSSLSFYNCNRNYVTSRMFNVAYSNTPTRVLAAGLDHGTVQIAGDPNMNTMGYGVWINPTGYNMGAFTEDSQAGPCIISMVNPKTIFVTYKDDGNGKPKVARSETAGADWVSTNFTENLTINSSSFRLPIALYEDFDDENNPDTAWFKNNKDVTIEAGTTVKIMSNNAYPFDYVLTEPLVPGDSIGVHDPISSRLYLGFTNSVYVTRGALRFDAAPDWYLIGASGNSGNGFVGEPLSMALSADGDHLFVGTKAGRLFRLSNLNTVVDKPTGTITDSLCMVTNTEITLPTSGQCITSIAVDPRDANKVLVTLGNYGNEDYVLYSTNALTDEPTFESKQGELPKMPVYSSVIAYDYSMDGTPNVPHFIIGTERGVYAAGANFNWTADSHLLGEVPVMDLKQQTHSHGDQYVTLISGQDTIINVYPGISNRGIIYAATYGKGVFRCENFKDDSNSGTNVPENPIAVESSIELYPNPVRDAAVVRFEVEDNATVSYQVFDMNGRMVMNQNLGRFAKGTHEINVNMDNLSTGSYIMRFNQGANNSCVKFLVY